MMKEVNMGFHLVQMKSSGPVFGQSVLKISIAKFESQW